MLLLTTSLVLVASTASAQEKQALILDDGCSDPSQEECGVSLRQLRGERAEQEVRRHEDIANVPNASADDSCHPWCQDATNANLCQLPDCKGCSFCSLPTGDTANVTYEVAGKGITCSGPVGFRSMMKPEECQAWCSGQADCKAYVTYEDSDCGRCVGILHHDCSKVYQESTSCSGKITAYSKVPPKKEAPVEVPDDGPGVCCFSGQSQDDVCGTCFPNSIAEEGTECAAKGKCSSCGGTWCSSVCITDATDPSDKCSSANGEGITKNSTCATSEKTCSACKGEWCKAGLTMKVVQKTTENTTEKPAEATNDTSKEADIPLKPVEEKCVMWFSDKTNPCGSASKNGIPKKGTYCTLSKANCENCKGAWCSPSEIAFPHAESHREPAATPDDDDLPEDDDDSGIPDWMR